MRGQLLVLCLTIAVGLVVAAVLAIPGPGAAAQEDLWQQSLDGLYGDVVVDLLLTGAPPVTIRSMLLLSHDSPLHRYNSDSGGWDAVYADPDRPRAEVLALALAGDDPQRKHVYAGIRGGTQFARSSDFGRSWVAGSGPADLDRLDRLASSTGSGQIYAARSDRVGLWTSTDHGVSWVSRTLPGAETSDARIDDLFASPDDPLVYLVRGGTLYKTSDDPTSWTVALRPDPTPPVTASLTVAYAAVGPRGRLHAAGERDGDHIVMTSEDRGVTWTGEGWPAGVEGDEPTALAAGELRPGVNGVWLGLESGRVFVSEDGGRSWTLVGEIPIQPTRIVVDPYSRDVWVGSYGLGLYRLTAEYLHTGAVSVKALAVAAPNYEAEGVVILNAEVLPERREDLGTMLPPLHGIFTSTTGVTWFRDILTPGLGSELIPSPDYAADRRLFSGRVVSTDGGSTWRNLTDGPSGEPPHIAAVGPITGTQPVLYALEEPFDDEEISGGTGLLYSEDGGGHWVRTDGTPPGIVDVAVSPAFVDDSTAFAVTGTGFVYRTQDATSFKFVGRVPAGDPFSRSIYDLQVSPDFIEDHTLMAAVEDHASGQWARVYVSSDSGERWKQRVTGLLSRSRPRSLSLSAAFGEDRIVFLGGRREVTDPPVPVIYASDTAGAEWFVEAFLPPGDVRSFAWAGTPPDGRLFAAGGSAGVWVRDLDRPIGETSSTATPTIGSGSPSASSTAGPSGTPTPSSTPSVTEAATMGTPTASPAVSPTASPTSTAGTSPPATTPPPLATTPSPVVTTPPATTPPATTPPPVTATPGARLYVPAAFKDR